MNLFIPLFYLFLPTEGNGKIPRVSGVRMNTFAIITNDACALPRNLREEYGVDEVFLGNVDFPDGHTEKADLDWERMTATEYFTGMADKKHIYKTSCANIDEIYESMARQAKQGKDIICIVLSAALSGTYGFSIKAAEKIMADYPNVKVKVIDSLRYSTALGMIVLEACMRRSEGLSFEETCAWVEEHKYNVHEMGMMDDMFFLARTGRVTKAKAFFGNLAGIEPMAEFNHEGMSEVVAKAKGKKKAIEAIVAYLKDRIVDPEHHLLFVCHSIREKEATFLAKLIEEQVPAMKVIVSSVDQSSGASIGPGLVAAFFYGKSITEGLVEEKALMAKILG